MPSAYKPAGRKVTATLISEESVTKWLCKDIRENGPSMNTLGDIFAVGAECADYTMSDDTFTHTREDEILDNNGRIVNQQKLREHLEFLKTAVFYDDKGEPIEMFKTISGMDMAIGCQVYVAIQFPGVNVVFYQRTDDFEDKFTVGILTDMPGTQSAFQIEPFWEEGNVKDKVSCSALFGFHFDKKLNVPITPTSRPPNAFQVGLQVAMETQKLVEKIIGEASGQNG